MKAIAILENTNNQIISVDSVINETLATRWINFIDVHPKSRETYGKAIRQLIYYLQENSIAQPTRDDIIIWRDELLATRKPSTVALYLVAAKLFFRWLVQENICAINPADHIKAPRIDHSHKKDALTKQDSRDVLNSFDTTTLKGKRDKALIALMMCCGLRTIEVTRANVSDLQKVGRKTFLAVLGKGRDERERVLIPKQVEALIIDYLQARRAVDKDSPLFAAVSRNNKGGRMATASISRIVKSTFRSVGIDSPRLTAHSLRHTCATNMLIAGVDIAKVQQILRHTNISTTQIYRHDLTRMDNDGEQIGADAIFTA